MATTSLQRRVRLGGRLRLRKRIKRTIKIKSRTSCTRPKGEEPDARRSPRRRGELRPALPPAPSLSLLCERAACQPAKRRLTGHQGLVSRIVMSCSCRLLITVQTYTTAVTRVSTSSFRRKTQRPMTGDSLRQRSEELINNTLTRH